MESSENQDILIQALNVQHNFRSFLGDILKKLLQLPDYPLFHSFSDKYVQFMKILEELKDSPVHLYKNYSYLAFLKDLCSDIVFNLKKERFQEYSQNIKISSYFSLFFVLKTFEINPDINEISFTYSTPTLLLEYVKFLTKEFEIDKSVEIFEVIIQVNSIIAELLDFMRNFIENKCFFRISQENTLDFFESYSVILNFLKILCEEPNLLAMQDLIIRNSFENFWWLLRNSYSRDAIIDIIRYSIQHEIYEESLIMAFFQKSENFTNFVEFFKKPEENHIKLTDIYNVWDITAKIKGLMMKKEDLTGFLMDTKKIIEGFIEKNDKFEDFVKILQIMMDFSCYKIRILSLNEENSLKITEKIDLTLIKIPEIYDIILSIYEKSLLLCKSLDNLSKSPEKPSKKANLSELIKYLLSSLFSILCQNPSNLQVLLKSDIQLLKRLIRSFNLCDYETSNLVISIINYSFLVSIDKYLLKIEDLNALILEIYTCENSEILEILLINTQKILLARSFEPSREILWILIEELQRILIKEANYIGKYTEKSLKTLFLLLKTVLKGRKNLFIELKSHKIFDYLLRINEDIGFEDFRVFLLEEEISAFGSKNLKKYLEIMLNAIKIVDRKKIITEIESFKKFEIFINILLIIRKLLDLGGEFKRILIKEMHIIEQFFSIFPILCEIENYEKFEKKGEFREKFILEYFALLNILCYKCEYLQFYISKKRFLCEKIYKPLKKHNLLYNIEIMRGILTIGLIRLDFIVKNNDKNERFFNENQKKYKNKEIFIKNEKNESFYTENQKNDKNSEISLKNINFFKIPQKTFNFLQSLGLSLVETSPAYKNMIILHENLSLYIKKCLIHLKNNIEIACFLSEFSYFFEFSLGIKLLIPLHEISLKNHQKPFFFENLDFFLKILENNKFKGPHNNTIVSDILLESIRISFENEEILPNSNENLYILKNFLRKFLETLKENRLSIYDFQLFPGKILFFPDIKLKTLDFSLLLWFKISEEEAEKSYNFINLLNFTTFKPEICIFYRNSCFYAQYQNQTKPFALELDNAFICKSWVFFGLTCRASKANILLSLYINGILKKTVIFLEEPPMSLQSSTMALVVGEPKTIGMERNHGFAIGPMNLFSIELGQKEMNLLYLINDGNGIIHMSDRKPKINFNLLNNENLDVLDLKTSLTLSHFKSNKTQANKEDHACFINCYLPDYSADRIIQIDHRGFVENLKEHTRFFIKHNEDTIFSPVSLRKNLGKTTFIEKNNENGENNKEINEFSSDLETFQSLFTIEKKCLYSIFIDLKQNLMKNIKKSHFSGFLNKCIEGKGMRNHGFIIGQFKRKEAGFLEISFKNVEIMKILEESEFLYKIVEFMSKNQKNYQGFFGFLCKICEISKENLLKELEGNMSFRENMLKYANFIQEDDIEMFARLFVIEIGEKHVLLRNPHILIEILVNLEFLQIFKGKTEGIFDILLKLLDKTENLFYK